MIYPGRGTSFSWSHKAENIGVNMQEYNILWTYWVRHSSCGAMTWFSWQEKAVHRLYENLLVMWTKNWILKQPKGVRAWEFQNPCLHSSKTTRFSYWVNISFFGGAIEVLALLKDLYSSKTEKEILTQKENRVVFDEWRKEFWNSHALTPLGCWDI